MAALKQTDKNISEVIGEKIKHIGIIMDGNGRWAKKRRMPREYGHKQGAEVFRKILTRCCELGIEASTFYVFSTENWGRSADEVSYIMKLAETRILKYAEKLATKNARMLILGSHDRISPKLAKCLLRSTIRRLAS